MRVEAIASEMLMQGDYGDVDGLIVRCSRCGLEVEVFGTEDASVKRAGLMLRNDCPRCENNFYDVAIR